MVSLISRAAVVCGMLDRGDEGGRLEERVRLIGIESDGDHDDTGSAFLGRCDVWRTRGIATVSSSASESAHHVSHQVMHRKAGRPDKSGRSRFK